MSHQVCCTQSPSPCVRPLLTLTSPGDTQTLKGRSGSVSVGPHGVHKVMFDPWSISGGYGVWFWKWFHPSYRLAGASLPLDVGLLFLVGSNILLLMVIQQWVVILEFSPEKMSAHPSTPPSCRQDICCDAIKYLKNCFKYIISSLLFFIMIEMVLILENTVFIYCKSIATI